MSSEKQRGPGDARAGDPAHDSPKRHGDKLGAARGKDAAPDPASDPPGDSPKRHGDKLEQARDAAAGRGKAK
jgi:hypothetical protein